MNNVHNILEFILWHNCKNNCAFCWQKQKYDPFSEFEKINSIDAIIDFIDNYDYSTMTSILLVGGELFDLYSKIVCTKLKKLFSILAYKLLKNEIEKLYINSNLLNTNIDEFYSSFIEPIDSNAVIDKILFTTSYDVYGRFSSIEAIDEWHKNLQFCKEHFTKLNITVNSILTKQFCDKLIVNDLDAYKEEVHNCNFNLIPYIANSSIMTPSRTEVFNALKRVRSQDPIYFNKYIRNMLDDNYVREIYKFNRHELEKCSADINECGHSVNFVKYSTSSTCFSCDLRLVFLNG